MPVNIVQYETFRKIGKELNHKIMKTCLDSDVLMKAAHLLGVRRGDTLFFDREDETNILMDFALHEYRVNNKNTVEIYREQVGGTTEAEKEILDALVSSQTSLFKIDSLLAEENAILLNDCMKKGESLILTDFGLSQTAIPGLLLFLRAVRLKYFNVTSGISFAFPANLEDYLLRRYKKISKKIEPENESLKRFISFFELHKTNGLEVSYE